MGGLRALFLIDVEISAVAEKILLQGGNVDGVDVRRVHVAGHGGSDARRFAGDQTGMTRMEPFMALSLPMQRPATSTLLSPTGVRQR